VATTRGVDGFGCILVQKWRAYDGTALSPFAGVQVSQRGVKTRNAGDERLVRVTAVRGRGLAVATPSYRRWSLPGMSSAPHNCSACSSFQYSPCRL